MTRSKIKRQNWENVELLIIDEVSMLSLKLFKILDMIGRKIKKKAIPFGGIQLIFVGDFYQLPPIGNEDDKESSMFCFESEIWEIVFGEPCFLETNFRQKDEKYNKILNQLRIGKIYSSSCKILQECREKKIDYENKLKIKGEFDNWEQQKMLENQKEQRKDLEQSIDEYEKTGGKKEWFNKGWVNTPMLESDNWEMGEKEVEKTISEARDFIKEKRQMVEEAEKQIQGAQ